MWLTESIKFPEQLIQAQRENRLVIFAGAGISKGDPSNLPLFDELADMIAEELLAEKRQKSEPIDNYLGQLVEKDKKVKQTAAKILDRPDSKSTSVHQDLIKLFPDGDRIKIITTNFDRHFTTVIKNESINTQRYYGPALPLGRNFNGLVYLHGAIENDISSFILTDTDFGKAYLSDGWATRFLKGVFERYTVLFIGYNHNDVVMNYLARGLPPNTSRYALTPKGNSQRWKYLNISPIEYEVIKDDGGEDHSELNRVISRWVKNINMKPLEHEERIKNIVSSKNPISPDESSYLLESIKDGTRVHVFIRNAGFDEKWLKWFSEKKVFSKKFSKSIDRGTFSRLIGWFVRECIVNAPNRSLNIVLNTKNINEDIWSPLVRELSIHIDSINSGSMSKWVATITQYGSSVVSRRHFGLLIKELQYPLHERSFLTLLSTILTPQVDVKSSTFSDYFYPKIYYDVDRYILDDILNQIIKDNISELSHLILPIITESITKAHYLWANFYDLNREVDFLSTQIRAIEKLDENNIHIDPIDKIKDIGREIIEFYAKSDPFFLEIVVEQWYQSDVPILMRLAVHGKRIQNNCSNSDKILWCCNRRMTFHGAASHEVSLLLREKYPHSNRRAKSQLMKIVDEKISQVDPSVEDDSLPVEVHQLLRMLEKVDPECNFIKKRLERLHNLIPQLKDIPHQEEKIQQFGSQPIHDKSPVSEEELKEKKPEEAVNLFNEMKEELENG